MIKLKTPFSRGMLISTICISLFLLVVLIISIGELTGIKTESYFHNTSNIGGWIAVAIIIAIFICCILLMPTSITIDDNSININRVMSKTVILKKDILFIRPKASTNNDVRTFGIGGAFGYLGYFYAKNWGKYTAYVTDGNNMVAIETTQKKYVVSCENTQVLIDSIKDRKVILK